MLIRFSGGSEGIVSYLSDGIKSGRNHTRNELDQRVQLQGNLEELDFVLNSFDLECKTQKYFHISLSFKERNINEDILRQIDKEFKEFIFAACVEDEFYYHSEIHFPKIKSLIGSHGKSYDRFPHIHVVIPEFNLITGKRDNPLGYVDYIERYRDAFQELINEKYGLESPKDNRRLISTGREDIISRYELSPDMSNKEIKQKIFSIIRDNEQISSVNELAQVIKGFGEVTVRNSEKFGQSYINLKIAGKAKGINLKDPVFLDRYLQSRDLKTTYEFSHADNQRLIDAWHEYAALEARFVEKSSKKEREAYATMAFSERKKWLAARWQKHLESIGHIGHEEPEPQINQEVVFEHITTANAHIEDIPHFDDLPHIDDLQHIDDVRHIDDISYFDNIGALNERSGSGRIEATQGSRGFSLHELRIRSGNGDRGQREPSFTQDLLQGDKQSDMVGNEKISFEELYAPSNEDGYRISHRIMDSHIQQKDSRNSEWSSIINNIDSRGLLNYLSYHYGLDTDDCRIEKNKYGNERIVLNDRRYSASDFLTKHMYFNWSEAKKILQVVAKQQQIGEHRRDAITSQLMWHRFMRHEAKQEGLASIKSIYYAQRKVIREQYKYAYNKKISRAENAAKRRLLHMQKTVELLRLKEEFEEQARYYRQRPHDRYMQFLYEEAEQGNKSALGELNRIYPLREYAYPDVFEIIIKDKQHPKQPFSPLDMGYQVKIKPNGMIEYKENDKTVIVDAYSSIKVTERSADTIANALELAKLRYGVDGFEIRNASEQDLAAIQSAVNKTGVSVKVIDKARDFNR